jgi:hypothetical protein
VENRLLKKTENSKIKTAKHIQNVKDAAKGQNDYEMSGLLSNATFIDKAVYHSGCIAKVFAHSYPWYLLRVLCSLVGKKDGSLLSVYYQGQMSSDFLQDLICTCKGKAVCSSGCVCFEQWLSCTDLCPCQAGEICRNSNTQMSRNKSIDDDVVDLLQLDVQE